MACRNDSRCRSTLDRGIGTGAAALALLAIAGPGPARAQAATQPAMPSCATRPYRWQEDCSHLTGEDLQGMDRLRYRPITPDGEVWLTVGGEARGRMELLHDIDFGIGGQPGYTAFAGRLLLHGDLRTQAGPRAFVQFGVVEQDGRKPGPRAQDESALDFTQAFVDAPFSIGGVQLTARVGRQEIDLSANRLVTSRDGATLRRVFEGAKLDVVLAGAKIAVVSVRPLALADEAFADRVDKTERFSAVSVDLPSTMAGGGALNLFLLDRQREDALFLRAQGRERRYSMGAHYLRDVGAWRVDAQGTWQTGRVEGLPVRAYGVALQFDRDLGGPAQAAVGFDIVASSGDKAGTGAIETFDPTYPNNGGLSDAPLFYQTNYVYAGGSLSARWADATWTAATNLLTRHSTSDAVYAGGRPIPAEFGDARPTSLLSQVSVRRFFGPRYEIYASLVRAQALGGIRDAGGRDAIYSRVQATARF